MNCNSVLFCIRYIFFADYWKDEEDLKKSLAAR